jgi:alginate O-acetyltransferase complex protein AlgI
MLFNSIQFLSFFPLFLLAYWAVRPQSSRKLLLLIGSFYFYAVWSVAYSALLFASIVINYVASQAILTAPHQRVKKLFLLLSIVVNLGILFFFKYYNFFVEDLANPLGMGLPALDLLLPMGISFYTFQSLSCTIDVYRGHFSGRYSLIDYALYISFFPQLVAGPIMRAGDLMPQFSKPVKLTRDRVLAGCSLACWGLIKKVFLAVPLARVVDPVYGEPAAYSGAALCLATYAFALQIYFDFSGYTDVARGTGQALGFDIAENFNAPYLATSLRDFWRRWHISLSTWLKDYLYIPLGGSRHGLYRTGLSLLITMLLGGLWHGAAWTFVIWGALHGGLLCGERLLAKLRALVGERLSAARELPFIRPLGSPLEQAMSATTRVLGALVTFHWVCLSWVFFRASDLSAATTVLTRIANWSPGSAINLWPLYLLAGLLAGQLAIERVDWAKLVLVNLDLTRALLRWFVYTGTALLAIALAGSETAEFIYFQF